MKAGIIGFGSRGKFMTWLLSNNGVEVVGYYDTLENEPAIEYFRKRAQIPIPARVASVDKLIGEPDIDVIVITSECQTHFDYIHRILRESDKKIIAEKPVVTLPSHLETLAYMLSEQNRDIQLIFELRYDPGFRRLRDIALEKLGGIERIECVDRKSFNTYGARYHLEDMTDSEYNRLTARERFSYREMRTKSGGILMQKAVHSLDIFNFLIGQFPTTITALGRTHVFSGDESEESLTCPACPKTDCSVRWDHFNDELAEAYEAIPFGARHCSRRESIGDILDTFHIRIGYEMPDGERINAIYRTEQEDMRVVNGRRVEGKEGREFQIICDKGVVSYDSKGGVIMIQWNDGQYQQEAVERKQGHLAEDENLMKEIVEGYLKTGIPCVGIGAGITTLMAHAAYISIHTRQNPAQKNPVLIDDKNYPGLALLKEFGLYV